MTIRLKNICLKGFKSFADKTTIEFSPGITVIVGPNGCGKSNIADSFRWVLGTQSARSLRGEEMKDFIFAGTTTRKPLNIAEVTLTLCDSDKNPNDELANISFTRRVHRDGGGEYLINGKPSRLKEMQTLFWDSGLSKDAFIIIEQGKVDQLITWTALERRTIFEEAAGIIRFKQRRKESLQRLEQLDQNLSRIKDIHNEIIAQVASLEGQAQKAIEYKGIQERIALLEKESMVAKFHEHTSNKEQQTLQLENLQASAATLSEQSDSLADILIEGKQTAHALSAQCEEKNQERSATTAQLQVLDSEIKNNRKRHEEAKRQMVSLVEEIGYLQQKRGAQQDESDLLEVRIASLQEDLGEIQTTLEIEQQTLKDIQERVNGIGSEKEELETRQHGIEKTLQTVALGIKEHATRIDGWQGQLEQIQIKLNELIDLETRYQQEIEEKTNLCEEFNDRIISYRDELEQSKGQQQGVQEALQIFTLQVKQQEKQLLEFQTRYKTFEQMHQKMEGLSKATQQLLKEASQEGSSLYGKFRPLYQLITLPVGKESLYAQALRFYSETLVVDSKEEIAFILAWAKEKKIEGFSLYPLEEGMEKFLQATEVGQLDELYQKVGKINKEFLSSDGGFIDKNGVLFYGKPTKENNPLLREQELRQLSEAIQEQEVNLEDALDRLSQQQEQLQHLQERRNVVEQQLRRDEMKQVEANFNLQRAKSQQQQQEVTRVQAESEILQLQNKIAEQQKKMDHLSLQQKEQGDLLQNLLERSYEIFESYRLLQEQQKEHKELVDRDNQKLREVQEEVRLSQQKLQILAQQDQEREARLVKAQEQLEEVQEQQSNSQEELEQFLATQEELKEVLKEVCEELARLKKEKEVLEEANSALKLQIEKLQESLHELELKQREIQVSIAQRMTFLHTLDQEFSERYHTAICEQVRQLPSNTPDEIEKEFRRTKKALEQMGNVNLSAIEQFQEKSERKIFIEEQLKDLIDSKEELLEAIAKLDTTSRKMFKDTFDQIRSHFQKNFQILFNGGHADIDFTPNEDGSPIDLLEAGIDIMARPPGKQMRSIQLLSGGEKCLTAMALLFAIFEVKPSPFCILDEIDAPLDETNIDRFTSLVKHYINTTQFIVISHNKRTMSIADMLFGVSMEERGVSKVLSVAFEKSHQ